MRWTLLLVSCSVWGQVVFLEPVEKINTRGAEITAKMPVYRKVAAPARFEKWLHNESAERALRLYRAAWDIAHPGGGTPTYYIALVEGGNHASVGFRLENGEEHAREAYILLDADVSRFDTTLLHETGHMAMETLAGGRQLDDQQVSSI